MRYTVADETITGIEASAKMLQNMKKQERLNYSNSKNGGVKDYCASFE